MPSPRKVDLLPPHLLARLNDELKRRGFRDYDQLADDLAAWCEQEGVSIRIGKSALGSYGLELRDLTRAQERVQEEIRVVLEQIKPSASVASEEALFLQIAVLQVKMRKLDVDVTELRTSMQTVMEGIQRQHDLLLRLENFIGNPENRHSED